MRDQIYLFLWSLVKRETRYAAFDDGFTWATPPSARSEEEEGEEREGG